MIIGYHGCDLSVATDIITKTKSFEISDKPYDWLGRGVYFWEGDEKRAWEWAERLKYDERIKEPAVVGALINAEEIDILDLTKRNSINLIQEAYDILSEYCIDFDQVMPVNKPFKNTFPDDNANRRLDCSVIELVNGLVEYRRGREFSVIRAMFPEGRSAYPDAGFKELTHVQIAVRDLSCITGCFLAG